MTPICTCPIPLPVVTHHPATPHYAAHSTTGCVRCGLTYSVKHGSHDVGHAEVPRER